LKNNLPILTNVTYPRFGAYSELIDPTLGVTHVVDLTIGYDDPDRPPSIVDILGGRRVSEVHFYYRIHPVDEEGAVRSEKWLREQWQLKDRILGEHYAEIQRSKANGARNERSRNSLSTSMSSKRSYSSMSPMSMSKEQINMLNDDGHTINNCPQDYSTTTTIVASPTSLESGNQINTANYNGSGSINNNQDLIKLNDDDDDIEQLKTNGNGYHTGTSKWNGSNQPQLDSSYPTQDVPIFDRTQGRPIVLSWVKLLSIHAFYLAVCLLVYEVIVLLL